MSLLPYMFREMMRPMRMMENQLRMVPEEFFKPMPSIFHYPVFHDNGSGESITSDQNKLQIKLDVKNFLPEELTVKTKDNAIVIEGKHEEKEDNHGFISRHFVRKFAVPNGHEIKSITSTLSAEGILTITAPKKLELESREKDIPITHIGGEEGKSQIESK